ncbi:MAG: S8 family serine peptidase [Acidobacteriota bacterium]|nr:S8 family serine peptidase [Acidobacteriota bacterium]
MKKLLSIIIAVLVCALVGNYFQTSTKAQILTNGSPIQLLKRQNFIKLIDSARETGTVRVIVGLNTQITPEGNLSKFKVSQQRLLIKQDQEIFLNRFRASRVTQIKQFEFIPFLALETDAATLEQMQNDSQILSIEEDELSAPTLAESTSIVGATAAWTSGFSGSGQAVAILDTGVAKNHNFLTGKIVSEACYSTNFPAGNATSLCPGGAAQSIETDSGLNCNTTISGCAHGTHVAGITAGRGANFSGVAKDANIIAIQVFSRVESATSCGSSPSPCSLSYSSDQIKALERVKTLSSTMSIASVNMSLGGGQYFSSCDAQRAAIKAAIDNLRSVGVATVISSGNSGYTDSMSSPACISSAISVGSTDDGSYNTATDVVSNFSNSVSMVTLLAPGRWINSSVASNNSNNSYSNYSGTSMSAPHVAAAFAVLKQHSPTASVTQLLNALISTGQPVTDSRNNVTKPRIKIAAALDAIITRPAQFDFDGDGKSDVSVYRSDNGGWYINQSMNGFTGIGFGQAGDKIVPADYDGDGKTDVAVYRAGTWYLQRSQAGFTAVGFGAADDIPQPADFDNDGRAELAVFRQSNGTWYVLNLTSNQFSSVQFGQAGDKPVVADYDGDGKADYAVYRNGGWYMLRSSQGLIGVQFGDANDKSVPADYDGDGKADVAVFRPSNGTWYLQQSAVGFTGISFGFETDLPAPADYDGDGKTDISVFRPSNSNWYLQRSQAGFMGVQFGETNDKPVANAFVF